MKIMLWLTSLVLLAASWLAACTPAATPPPEPKNTAVKATAAAASPDWTQKWESQVAAAKKEGSVTVYAIWGPKIRAALVDAFKAKYGIDVEFSPFSRGSDLLAKVQAENRAGIYSADVFGAGNPTMLGTMKPEGVLGTVKPVLVLPEVLDPKAWYAGGVPYTDKDGQVVSLIGATIRTVVYNTGSIKEGEIASYKDLLKPQYKGKITLNDPLVTGTGNAGISHLGLLWGEAETIDFLKRLVKDQEVVIQRDQRVHMESVARGKYAIALAPMAEQMAEFLSLAAPIKIALVKEDNRLTAGAGALGVPTKFAHPNAAAVFINWLLTKEGMTAFSGAFGNPSTRIDAPKDKFDPLLVPVPGEKYYAETEEVLDARVKWMDLARKVIEENSK